MLNYQLGQFIFHGMWGGPKFEETIIECETRPGVKGISIHDIGKWGKPFEIATVVFVPTFSDAVDTIEAYAAAAADNALVMVIGSKTVVGTLYKVKTVDAGPPKAVIVKSPPAIAGRLGEVRARWTLLPIGLS